VAGCPAAGSTWLRLRRDLLALLLPLLMIALYKAPFPPLDRHLGGICPPLLPRILSWGRLLLADWPSLGMACVTPVLCLCRTCRGQATFGKATVGGILSSSPGSGSPRWSRQPAAGAAGPLAGAGLPYLTPWRLLGRQPVDCAALGIPLKSSPHHYSYRPNPKNKSRVVKPI
jgi:hypothetical protein